MKQVFLYTHSHWDREWYREFEEFRLRLVEVVNDILTKIQLNELPSFYFDGQTAALEDYLQIHPENKSLIQKLINEKKLFIGPFYCSADSFLVSAEFLIRNLFIGLEYSKTFGCKDFIGYLSDTFGHSLSMNEILNSFDIHYAMLWRGLGNLPSEFIWKNIYVTYLIQGYFQDFLSINENYDKKAELLKKYLDKIAEKSSNAILLPCGADHLKVADNIKNQLQEINKRLKNYEIKLSNPFEYLNAVKNNYKMTVNHEFLDASKNFLLKGVYSSRIYQKQLNAITQWELSRISEPLASIYNILNLTKNWQKELDYAYKTIIKNHAHDSIYGCSIDPVHKDVAQRFAHALQISQGIKKRVIRDISENCDELKFINLSNFNYNGLVEIETEKTLPPKYNAQLVSKRKAFPDKKLFDPAEIPITEDITTIKKYLIEVKNLKPFTMSETLINKTRKNKISHNSIENDDILLKINYGQITLKDKKTNKVYKNFIEITDKADIGDSYNFGALKNDKPILATPVSSKILKNGHLKSVLRVIFEINIPKSSSIKTLTRSKKTIKHKIIADISVSNLEPQINFELNWNNKSKNHLLQIRFNLENDINKTFSEDTIGIVEREFDPTYNIYDYIPAKKGIELKTNIAPMQRFVWAQNCGIVTKGLNEYEVYKNTLNLTLLRSTELISEPKNPCRGTPAGPPITCPDLQCLGQNYAKFCIRFCQKPSQLYQTAELFYGSIIPLFSQIENISPFNIKNSNILIQALKLDKQENLIIRLVNISNNDELLNLESKFKKVWICNSQEEILYPYKTAIKIKSKSLVTLKCQK